MDAAELFESRVNKLEVTVESLVESNAKIQSTLEILLEKFESKVISPMRTPEDTFLQDEALNGSTPENTANMQFEPLTEAKMQKKKDMPVEVRRQTMLDNALDQGLPKGSLAPTVNVSAVKSVKTYGQTYPKTSNPSWDNIVLLHENMNTYQRSCGSRPSIWDCLTDELIKKLYQSSQSLVPLSIFIAQSTEKQAMGLLMTFNNPRSKESWFTMFNECCPPMVVNATADPEYLIEMVIPSIFAYILKFNSIFQIAIATRDQSAIPNLRKDTSGGMEDRNKLNLIHLFHSRFPDGIMQSLTERYSQDLRTTIGKHDKAPSTLLDYTVKVMECLREWSTKCEDYLQVYLALKRNIQTTARAKSVNLIGGGLHNIHNGPNLDKQQLTCYAAVRNEHCNKQSCPYSHNTDKIKQARLKELERYKNLLKPQYSSMEGSKTTVTRLEKPPGTSLRDATRREHFAQMSNNIPVAYPDSDEDIDSDLSDFEPEKTSDNSEDVL